MFGGACRMARTSTARYPPDVVPVIVHVSRHWHIARTPLRTDASPLPEGKRMRMTGETSVDGVAELARRTAEALAGRPLACAESCTAGRVSASLAGVGGASEWLRGGLVAYQAETKRSLLHVTAPSVFSEQAATEMVRGAADLFGARVAVATTGVIGDDPEEGLPPGTLMIGTMVDGDIQVLTRHLGGRNPEERCQTAVGAALSALLDHLASRS